MKRLAAVLATVGLSLVLVKPVLAAPDNPFAPAIDMRAGQLRLAQLKLNFGVSDARVLRSLRQQGYTEIEIFYRGLTKARARACKNGARWQMEVAPDGRIKNSAKIGECRVRINVAQAQHLLQKKGYRNILLEETARGDFRGAACLGRKRLEMVVSPFGKVRELGLLGKCRQLLSRKEVAARLRSRGYSRIRIADDSPPPPFFAEACKNRDKVKLVIVGNGRIQRENIVGRCNPPIDPAQIAAIVERQGFTRVSVTDDVLPRYAAEACRGEVRVELALNRFGEIREERKIGECASALTRAQLIRQLREEGFRMIRVDDRAGGFLVEACQGNERFRINMSRYGETSSHQALGPCESPRIGKLIGEFEGRGLSDVTFYVEGCRKGRRVKIELDRFGTKVKSRRLGRCQ